MIEHWLKEDSYRQQDLDVGEEHRGLVVDQDRVQERQGVYLHVGTGILVSESQK